MTRFSSICDYLWGEQDLLLQGAIPVRRSLDGGYTFKRIGYLLDHISPLSNEERGFFLWHVAGHRVSPETVYVGDTNQDPVMMERRLDSIMFQLAAETAYTFELFVRMAADRGEEPNARAWVAFVHHIQSTFVRNCLSHIDLSGMAVSDVEMFLDFLKTPRATKRYGEKMWWHDMLSVSNKVWDSHL